MPGDVDDGHGVIREDAGDEGAFRQFIEAGDRGPSSQVPDRDASSARL